MPCLRKADQVGWERLQSETSPVLEHRLGSFGVMHQDESSDDESVEQILVDLRWMIDDSYRASPSHVSSAQNQQWKIGGTSQEEN